MSVDTNLHRTFDYQLSSASLRIIDWAPIRSAAATVLQSGISAKSYHVVDRTSTNEAAIAAVFARQESAKQEALRAQRCSNSSDGNGSGGAGGPSPSFGAAGGDTAASFAERRPSDSPAVSTAVPPAPPPPTTALPPTDPSAIVSAPPPHIPGEMREGRAAENPSQPQQQQRSYDENWTGSSNGVASASPGGGLFFSHGSSPTPAAAAATSSVGAPTALTAAEGTALPSSAAAGLTLAGSSNGVGTAHIGGRSGAATPKTGAAVGVAPWTHSPSTLTPEVARYRQQWGAAGTMYGFDSVYRNGSFGVLLGLFTGLGYQQTNVLYRQQERGAGGEKGRSAPPTAAAVATATAKTAVGGSNPVSVANSVNSPSPSEGNAVSPAADGSTGLGSSDGPSNDGVVAGVGAAAAAGGAGSSPHAQHARMDPVIAYRSSGSVQLSNVIQCFWYWGARRWTGVFNLRFTPLWSTNAILPVCECVTRTEITETSILIDDPVVYIHGFVVMLGRRKWAPDDGPSPTEYTAATAAGSTDPVRSKASHADTIHPLAVAAADEVSCNSGNSSSSSSSSLIRTQKAPCQSSDARTSVNGKSAELPIIAKASRPSGRHPTAGANAVTSADNEKTMSVSPLQRHTADAHSIGATHGQHAVSQPASPHSLSHASSSSISSSDGTQDGSEMPSWYYWYQRCLMDTSDEWLWDRTAAEVAADVAKSTTAWWKLRHVKTGVGLSYRYRKPRGINVYWGWSAQLGRGTSLSGNVDVLRRMSCSISSSFGYLDVSARLRLNLITLHQTALDAGLCWRPLPRVPELAVRVATSANGTTLGLEVADVGPLLYTPVVQRLADYRARHRKANGAGAATGGLADGNASSNVRGSDESPSPATAPPPRAGPDGHHEDLVGLLPVTWHYLRGFGTTITHAYSGVSGAIASTWRSTSAANAAQTEAAAAAAEAHRTAVSLPVSPAFTAIPPTPSLAAESTLSGVVLPLGRAGVRHLRHACRQLADLGWLETMLRTSHVNVSVGITAEPGKLTRDWRFFLILSEK
ncbi:hypothetical protein ABB37_06778 [Leptomonas pyrrhocoris]|uniref:Uncharacterized protein n=1 Tax=Leptomonas pyrrhocoris TaxID=157538 RepID=A0A0M9FXQ3_LEPPY|nr:hypothetical protein ABB37_06778 [Leptomonas pyrrhocoris]XP_015656466.1 hypothetical protein ABB37_06778 [Leptomonas pyrrhocoris]KPA78026.1 hypothetical protein ABB37_06778 [Leptomonas pyrrhocoris]KPA78027.1 hypothetical protein ABB37_06778 [Leptomonas pyrrhocoris]|eukprot:XP_015656465.1 hypothetical protein ABB37_06778 [Leptomonas pyrrhocoris]